MFDLLSSHIEPEYKKCFSLYQSKNLESSRSKIIRLSFTTFIDKKDFESRCLAIAFSDYSKYMTSGQKFNGASLIIANDFGEKGKIVTKQLIQMINQLTKTNNWKIYPSSDIPAEFFYKLKEVQWPEGIDIAEPDYISLLHTILATKKSFGENLLSVCFDWEYDESFNQFFKYYHIDVVDNPEGVVLVTNKFITDEKAGEIVNLKPRAVISFIDGTLNDYNDDRPMGRFKLANIHVIPSGITKLGNTLVADSYINDLRPMEQTFKLIETTGQRVQSIWKIALEKRINFNEIVSEITKANIGSNRFKLASHDVGDNTYKA